MDGVVPFIFLTLMVDELIVLFALIYAAAVIWFGRPERRGRAQAVAAWCLAGSVIALVIAGASFQTIIGYSPLPYIALGQTVWSVLVLLLSRRRKDASAI